MDHSDQRDYAEEQYNRAEMEREGREEMEAEAIESRRDIPSVTQWACVCCTLVMANGECCDRPDHGGAELRTGEGAEPLSEIPSGATTTLGMSWHEHSTDCPNWQDESATEYRGWVAECDCDRRTFSWSRCDGCGSNLGGSRHAFIVWTPAINTVA